MKNLSKAFDKLWAGWDKLWEQFDREFDEVLSEAENSTVKTHIHIRLTRKQLMGLLTGEYKQHLFKVKEGVAIQVEMKP